MQIQNIKIKQELEKIKEEVDYICSAAGYREEVEQTNSIILGKLEMLINIIDWEE